MYFSYTIFLSHIMRCNSNKLIRSGMKLATHTHRAITTTTKHSASINSEFYPLLL